jgi:hypothetical protein
VLLDDLDTSKIDCIADNSGITHYPFLVSPCLNGTRIYVEDGVPYDLNKKIITNKYIRDSLLCLGQYPGVFEGLLNIAQKNDTKSVRDMVRSEADMNALKFIFHIHDHYLNKEDKYNIRLERLLGIVKDNASDHIAFMPQKLIYSEPQLIKYEKVIKSVGYDGIIIRKFDGLYAMKGSPNGEQIIVYKPLSV